MKRNWNLYGIAALLAVFFLAVGVIAVPVTPVGAQVKEDCDNKVDDDGDKLIDCDDPDCDGDPACDTTPPEEICDNGTDDDDDKLIDCQDPDCAQHPSCKPPEGEGCSPGYWKNHEDHFNAVCGSVPGWTCDELWTAVNCRGNNAACRRSEAADALNAVSGCTE